MKKFNSLSEMGFADNVVEDLIDWKILSKMPLSEKFIEKYVNKVNWYNISWAQKLSEKFIEKHLNEVDWYCISAFQKLSEAFIEKYSFRVNWKCIGEKQILSKEFSKKYLSQLINGLIYNKKTKLSDDNLIEFISLQKDSFNPETQVIIDIYNRKLKAHSK
jgi:hypothetical protein